MKKAKWQLLLEKYYKQLFIVNLTKIRGIKLTGNFIN